MLLNRYQERLGGLGLSMDSKGTNPDVCELFVDLEKAKLINTNQQIPDELPKIITKMRDTDDLVKLLISVRTDELEFVRANSKWFTRPYA